MPASSAIVPSVFSAIANRNASPVSALLGGGRSPPSASWPGRRRRRAPRPRPRSRWRGPRRCEQRESRRACSQVAPSPRKPDGEHAAREVVDAERDRRPAVGCAVGLRGRAGGEAREAERPAGPMGSRPRQRASAEARREAAAMSAVATGIEVAPNAIARGTGDTREIRPARVATRPPGVVAWCRRACPRLCLLRPERRPLRHRRRSARRAPRGARRLAARRRCRARPARALPARARARRGRARRAADRSARQRRERAGVRGDIARDARRRHPRRPARARPALPRGAPAR